MCAKCAPLNIVSGVCNNKGPCSFLLCLCLRLSKLFACITSSFNGYKPLSHVSETCVQAAVQVRNDTFSAAAAALVLDLFHWKVPSDTPSDQTRSRSDLRTSAVAKLGRLRSKAGVDAKPLTNPESPSKAQVAKAGKGSRASSSSPGENSPASSSSNSSAGSRASSRGSQREAAVVAAPAAAAAAGDSPKEAEQKGGGGDSMTDAASGTVMSFLGRVVFPLRQLSDDRTGRIAELEGQLLLAPGTSLESGAEQDSVVSIEVQAWSAEALAAVRSQSEAEATPAGDAEVMCIKGQSH